jgi:hypothetical protein
VIELTETKLELLCPSNSFFRIKKQNQKILVYIFYVLYLLRTSASISIKSSKKLIELFFKLYILVFKIIIELDYYLKFSSFKEKSNNILIT